MNRKEYVEQVIVEDPRYFAFSIVGNANEANATDEFPTSPEDVESFDVSNIVEEIIKDPKFILISFPAVLDWAKQQKIPEVQEYEQLCTAIENFADASNLQERENLKKKRGTAVSKILKQKYDLAISDYLVKREEEKKRLEEEQRVREELQREQEEKERKEREKKEKKKAKSSQKDDNSDAPSTPTTETVKSLPEYGAEESAVDSTQIVEEPEDTRVFFVLKDFPLYIADIEAMFESGLNFHSTFVIRPEVKKGPPPLSDEEIAQVDPSKNAGKKPPAKAPEKKPAPKAKKAPKKGKGIEERYVPLYLDLRKTSSEAAQKNMAANTRRVLVLDEIFYEYTYEESMQDYNLGNDIDKEKKRVAQNITKYMNRLLELKPKFSIQVGSANEKLIESTDFISDPNLDYFRDQLSDIPSRFISVSIVLHSLIEQVVKLVDSTTDGSMDESKLEENTQNIPTLVEEIFSDFEQVPKVSNTVLELERKPIQLINFGDELTEHAVLSDEYKIGPYNLSVIEHQMLTKRCAIDSFFNMNSETLLDPLEEQRRRGSLLTEVYYFVSQNLQKPESDYLISQDEMINQLLLSEIENVLQNSIDLSSRIVKQNYSHSGLLKYLAELILFNQPVILSKYFDLLGVYLLVYHFSIPNTRFIATHWKRSFSTKPYFGEYIFENLVEYKTQLYQQFEKLLQDTATTIQNKKNSPSSDQQPSSTEQSQNALVDSKLEIVTMEEAKTPHIVNPSVKDLEDLTAKERCMFEGTKGDYDEQQILFFPYECGIVSFSRFQGNGTDFSQCSIFKDQEVFSISSNLNTSETKMFCSFKDDSSLKIQHVEKSSLCVSYCTSADLKIFIESSGLINQTKTANSRTTNLSFINKSNGDKIETASNLSADSELICVWNEEKNCVEKATVVEVRRALHKDGSLVKVFADGYSQTIHYSGLVCTKTPNNNRLYTKYNGDRFVVDKNGVQKIISSILVASNVDPDTEARVYSREDSVISIEFKNGTKLIQFVDGTKIWDCSNDSDKPHVVFERKDYANMCYELDENKQCKSISVEDMDSHFYSKLDLKDSKINVNKPGNEFIIHSTTQILEIIPSKLKYQKKRSSSLPFGLFCIHLDKGCLKTIDLEGNVYLISKYGTSFVYYNSVENLSNGIVDLYNISQLESLNSSSKVQVHCFGTPKSEGGDYVDTMHLFVIDKDLQSGYELMTESALSFLIQLKEDNTYLSEDRTSNNVTCYSFLTKNEPKRSIPIPKVKLPKVVLPLIHPKARTSTFLHHRQLLKFEKFSPEKRDVFKKKFREWQEWSKKREAYGESLSLPIVDNRSEEKKKQQEEVKEEIQNMIDSGQVSFEDEGSEYVPISYEKENQQQQQVESEPEEKAKREEQSGFRAPSRAVVSPSIDYLSQRKTKKTRRFVEQGRATTPQHGQIELLSLEANEHSQSTPMFESPSSDIKEEKKATVELPPIQRGKQLTKHEMLDRYRTLGYTIPREFNKIKRVLPERTVHVESIRKEEANATLNERYKIREANTKHTLKTSSMKQIQQHFKEIAPLDATRLSLASHVSIPQSAEPDVPKLSIFPSVVDFGLLRVGNIYRTYVNITNYGNLSGRFIVKYHNNIHGDFRVVHKKGPVAPGITSKIEFELNARQVQEVSFQIEIDTEESIIMLPVVAQILSETEFDQNNYDIKRRVSIK